MRFFLLLTLYLGALPALAQRTNCEGGMAQPVGSPVAYPCDRVDFLSRLPLAEMGGAVRANDIWGWTDPEDGSEYALVGLQGGTAFVDVSDPEAPVYLGTLPTHTQSSTWRDIKVYADHAFVVADGAGPHGMQVFDLTQLRDVASPQVFAATARYTGINSAHNIAINETTGFAYVVGSSNGTESGCGGGLHMVNIQDPASPVFAGCFAEDGYTHDAQCVIYDGPDAEHVGKEVCFVAQSDSQVASNNHFSVIDVTEKQSPILLSQVLYPNQGYAHQGWLTEDQRYFIGNDELDEQRFGDNTRTLVFDVSDLDEPEFRDVFVHDTPAIDHNLYVKGPHVFETNDAAGLRILDASALLAGAPGSGLEAAAFFDTYPEGDAPVFEGAWSSYPFFESGIVVVNDRSRGLFVLQPRLTPPTAAGPDAQPESFEVSPPYPNPFTTRTTFTIRVGSAQRIVVEVYDVLGRRIADLFRGTLAAGEERTVVLDGNGWPTGTYLVRVLGEGFAETRRVVLTR